MRFPVAAEEDYSFMSLLRIGFIRTMATFGVLWTALALGVFAQTISTTTVQGTVYLADGSPGSGTLQVSWPAFTTAANLAVAAGKVTVNIGADGFASVNLAPNLGSSPAGLFYTAVYHMSDGTTSTEFWVVPAAAQASIGQVRSQVMPAAQAVQAVSKAYVDQAIQSVAQGNLTSTGGQLTGPLYLTGDPTQALQAADKHYVDTMLAQAVPLAGWAVTGPLTAKQLGAAYQVDQFSGADFGAKLQACLAAINNVYGGTCDARNFSGNVSIASDVTISTANAAVMLPCATISTAKQIIVTPGTRNVSLRGCSLRGASNASGNQGGTVLLYSGSAAAVQIGDPTYSADTLGFHLDNVLINVTASSSSGAQAIAAYRTQEIDLESLYLLGNANQTGITLDGTGNYTGGTFYDSHISGFQTALNGVGHQVTNSAATDWLNASTFVRLHINCPTNNGSPISGTYGINLQQGDGNSFTGGDVEGCATALHLGVNAQNNTIVGLRNENSTFQVVADAGSSYNSWMTGGTMFTGKLSDNGTRNSFLDTFHRSFNSLNGDWYGSQQDATVTNHFRLGIGNGSERGLLDRYQTDDGYRWTIGLSDATGGEQYYQVLDELNHVYRISVGQYNEDQASTNNQTVINAAGTGAVVLNGSNNSGTGGVVFGSGGPSETTVATVSNAGNAQFNGTLQVGGTTQSAGTVTVRNNADSEVDYYLWPGLTASQKDSFTYKDYNGNSQWFMVKDASNNWALNSATGGLDSFKAYQSTNSGDTYINASNSSGVVRVNYEAGSGSAFNVYGGGSGNLYASFSGTNAIKFPGLSSASGRNCLQVDSTGYISNTGAACGSGSGSGTVNGGSTGQLAYYSGNGTAVSGLSTVPVSAGGTGATSAAAGLAALGGASLVAATEQKFAGPINSQSVTAQSIGGVRYAAQYQTGGGNNGILNAIGSNQLVVADPGYAATEQYGFENMIPGVPAQFQLWDTRAGLQTHFFHNWSLKNWGQPTNAADFLACLDDKYPLSNSNYSYARYCKTDWMISNIPGWSFSTPPYGTQGWRVNLGHYTTVLSRGSGIDEAGSFYAQKFGAGDNTAQYFYSYGEGGWTAPNDEGTKTFGANTLEVPNRFSGTCSTGCTTGSQSIKTSNSTLVAVGKCTDQTNADCSMGTGRYLIDTTVGGTSTTASALTAGNGSGSAVTVAATVPASNAVAMQAVNCGPATIAANVTVPPFTSSYTCNMTVVSGTFDTSHLVCFASQFHECAIPTAVGTPSGGVQSITIPLRKPHASGGWVYQGGMAGYGLEWTAFNQNPQQNLRFLFDIVGSTDAHTLQVQQYNQGAPTAITPYLPTANVLFGSWNVASLSNSGATVSGQLSSGGSFGAAQAYGPTSWTFAGASDSAFNTGCTNTVWTTSTNFTCTIAGLAGSHTATTATAKLTGVASVVLWPMAEVTDVQNETSTPAIVDGTLALEPNVIAFAANDTVEETHHAAGHFEGATITNTVYNPYNVGNGLSIAVAGAGASNQRASSLAANAGLRIANSNPDSLYTRGGGYLTPLNAINLPGNWYDVLDLDHAPHDSLVSMFLTTAQNNDPNFTFNGMNFFLKTGNFFWKIAPYSGNYTWNTPGAADYTATAHTFHGAVALPSGSTVNGKQANGVGAAITTGPGSGTTIDHIVTYNGTDGSQKDSGVAISSLAPLASPTFTGNPAAPTDGVCGAHGTQLATEDYVASCGGKSLVNGVVSTTSYTMTNPGYVEMQCAGACTLTLPATPPTGFAATINATGAGAVTISPNGKTNTGVASLAQGQAVYISWNGTAYGTGPVTNYGDGLKLTFGAGGSTVALKVANVQITTGTTQIAANGCTSNTATAMTGATTTSVILPPTPTSTTVGVTGWGTNGLVFKYYVTANTFNWSVCNVTGSSITPGASITWNVGAR